MFGIKKVSKFVSAYYIWLFYHFGNQGILNKNIIFLRNLKKQTPQKNKDEHFK